VSPHDAPSTGELIESVREWLERDVLAATEGRLQYHTRVAINVLSIVERELAVATLHDVVHRERLETLGVADDAELAEAIRSGALDDRIDEVRALVWQSVRDKLAVANPKYLSSP
jgi:hypothetical protein